MEGRRESDNIMKLIERAISGQNEGIRPIFGQMSFIFWN